MWYRFTYESPPFFGEFHLEVLGFSKENALERFIDLKPNAEILRIRKVQE